MMRTVLIPIALGLLGLPAAAIAQSGGMGPTTPMGARAGAMGTLLPGPMGLLGGGPMGTLGRDGPMGSTVAGTGGAMGTTPAFAAGDTSRSAATLGATSSIGTARATRGDPSGASRIGSGIGSSIMSTVNSAPSRTVEGDAPAN